MLKIGLLIRVSGVRISDGSPLCRKKRIIPQFLGDDALFVFSSEILLDTLIIDMKNA